MTLFFSNSLSSILLKSVDCGLACVLFVAPWFMGGRHPLGQFVLISIICLTSVLWLLRQCLCCEQGWHWSGAEQLLAAAVAFNLLQLVPLPEGLLRSLSPGIADTLPFWFGQADEAGRLGTWTTISLAPQETRGGGILCASYALLFMLTCQRIKHLNDVERLLKWIAMAVAGVALIGLVQYVAGNGRFLWIYEHPFRNTYHAVKGPFSNENHFADLMALGIPAIIFWMMRLQLPIGGSRGVGEKSTDRRPGSDRKVRKVSSRSNSNGWTGTQNTAQPAIRIALAILLGVVTLAGLLTFSRGGVLVIMISLGTCVLSLWVNSLLGRRSVALLLAVGMMVGAGLLIKGYVPLTQQMGTLISGSIDEIDSHAARRLLWQADLSAIREFPFFGTGAGTHALVYPIHFSTYADVEFTHAESGFLQILLESGIVGLTLAILAIVLVGYWCLSAYRNAGNSDRKICVIAFSAALIANLLHSVWDFVWYIPACMSVTVILAACAARSSRLLRPDNIKQRLSPIPGASTRSSWGAAAGLLAVVSAFMIYDRLPAALAAPAWDQYQKVVEAEKKSGIESDTTESLQTKLPLVVGILRKNPADARAHLVLAGLCLQCFESAQSHSDNPLPLDQIRDAALTSGFPSLDEQNNWLSSVVGENRKYLDQARHHLRRSLQNSPLFGEGYVLWSELAFLSGGTQATIQACLKQALRVRPYSGAVLIAAGKHAALEGDFARAFEYWKAAFHQNPAVETEVIHLLAPQQPAEFFLQYFQPEVSGLQKLFARYRSSHRDEQARVIGAKLAEALENSAKTEQGQKAQRTWSAAAGVRQYLHEGSRAVECLQKAIVCDANNSSVRKTLARQLISDNRFEEAIEQFRWCLRQTPEDRSLQLELERAYRLRLSAPQSASATSEVSSIAVEDDLIRNQQ